MKKLTSIVTITAMLAMGFAGSAHAGGMRTVWVLSDQPESLSLKFNGHEIASFDQSWQRTGMGYMVQISFPAEYASRYDSLTLVREDGRGWSKWHPEDMSFLRHSNVNKDDPACVGGKAWCAVRGL